MKGSGKLAAYRLWITAQLTKQIQIARVYNIPVQIDYRWFIVFALTIWVAAISLERHHYGPTGPMAWAIGAITTVILFLCVFGHELSHALVGRAEGIETEEIVLHPFGGLARLKHEPSNPKAEFRIAVAGPAASFLFSLIAFGIAWVASLANYLTTTLVFWVVGSFNLFLSIFNLLPGYPLDGGRILRAMLWHRNGDLSSATQISNLSGQAIGWLLTTIGAIICIRNPMDVSSIWTLLIGLSLLRVSGHLRRQPRKAEAGTVTEIMSTPILIEPDIYIGQLVDEILPQHPQSIFLVSRERRLYGLLLLEDIKTLQHEKWRTTLVRDVMRPVDESMFIESTANTYQAEQKMKQNQIGALAVINKYGEIVGFLKQSKQ
jgi:Zn-dependent protease